MCFRRYFQGLFSAIRALLTRGSKDEINEVWSRAGGDSLNPIASVRMRIASRSDPSAEALPHLYTSRQWFDFTKHLECHQNL